MKPTTDLIKKDPIKRMRDRHEKRLADAEVAKRHTENKLVAIESQETIIKAVRSLVDYLDHRTSKTEIVNQLESIATPDALKVVEAVNELHESIKTHENTDLSEVTRVLHDVLEQAKQIPKDKVEIDIPSEVSVSNLPDHSKDFENLLTAVKAIKLVAEAPVVDVKPADVHVAPTDLSPLEKATKAVEKAIKAIVLPEFVPTDIAPLVKEQKKTNKLLDELADISARPSGGGGGRATPYEVDGTPRFVELEQQAVPTASVALATRLDTVTTADVTYIGKAPTGSAESEAVWQIAKLDVSSGLSKTWADGDSQYNNVWDNRASLTYV